VLFGRPRARVAPGAVHVPDWLSDDEQRELAGARRDWATPPAGIRPTVMPSGRVMSVQTVCLGWHRELRVDSEGSKLTVVDPQRLNELVGIGQGVDVGPAEPVDPVRDHRAGGLGGDAV
jgi:hypothetical protein